MKKGRKRKVDRLRGSFGILMAAAVLFNTLPASGLAVSASEQGTGLCEHHTEHTAECGYSEENGTPCGYQCSVCGIEELSSNEASGNVASVTKDGETTFIADLADAFTTDNNGAEIKLLSDVTVSQKIEVTSNFPASLDLAGHTVYADVGDDPVFCICESADFTIKDSAGNGVVKGQVQTYSWSANLTLVGGRFESVSLSMGKKLTVTGENVHIDDLFINTYTDITAQLSAGTYGHIYHGYGCKRLLANGSDKFYAFYDEDDKPVAVYDSMHELNNVTVRECSHDSSVIKYERVDDTYHKMTCLACGYEGASEQHDKDENGCCSKCSAVKVTLNGSSAYLSNLADAFKSEYDGASITLLGNINVNEAIKVTSGAFTLDLAGKVVNFSGTNVWLEVGDNANLTICDSADTGCLNSIYMSWQNNSAVLTLEGGNFDSIYVGGGKLIVTDDKVSIERLSTRKDSAQLSAGTYGRISMQYSSDGYCLGDILLNYGQTEGKHYAFYDSEEKLVAAVSDGEYDVSVQNVTVRECYHNDDSIKEYTRLNEQQHKVTCLACGYGSNEDHNTLGEGGLCECNAVKVERNDTVEYKSSLNDAFLNAESGAVITLLKDTKGGEMNTNYEDSSFTLDLNGHTISGGLEISGIDLKIQDSANSGMIEQLEFSGGMLTVNGGQFASDYYAACLTNCTAEINSGDFSGRRFGIVIDNSDVTINGGSFNAAGQIPPQYEDMGDMDEPAIGLLFANGALKLRGGVFSGKDSAVCIENYSSDEGETAVLSDLLGHTDTKRYAYYNGTAPVTDGLDGTSLKGTITVQECGHEAANFTNNDDGTHTYNCVACGDNGDTENCTYDFNGATGTCAMCKDSLTVAVSGDDIIYDGTGKEPGVTVTRNGTELTVDVDYQVVYTGNTSAGKATVTVTIGNNQGTYTGNFTIDKATPYIAKSPAAAGITYGDTLNVSALSGGTVQYGNGTGQAGSTETVDGTFTWKEPSAKPAAADSGVTEYTVVFTPSDTANYNPVEAKVTLTVNKAQNAPNMPDSTMDVSNSLEKAGDVPLPEGWEWQASDRDTALEVGKQISVVAVYAGADKGNYENETITVVITRSACDHVAGDVLYTGAGEKAPTCTEDGLGHRECTKCGTVVESGIVINALGHDWHITSEEAATTTSEGKREYTCSKCGQKREESIPKLPLAPTETPGQPEEPTEPAKPPQENVTTEKISENSVKLDSGISIKWNENAVALKWTKIAGAEGYDIFATESGKKLSKNSLVKTVKNGKISVSITKIDGKKISEKKVYTVKIKAWKYVDGKKVYIGSSRTYRMAGKDNKKYTNAKSLKPEKNRYVLKTGGSVRIKVTIVKQSKKKKMLPASQGPALQYWSDNEKIATVTQDGKVKAKKKGTCYIYVTALNGVRTKIKITVK